MGQIRQYSIIFWEYIKTNPIEFTVIFIGSIIGLWLALNIFRYSIRLFQSNDLVFLKIILPRDDSPKDKEKDTDKDFREKISIMAQFFRNLHETGELNMMNSIKTMILQNNIFSFELVAQNKVLDFYVTTPKYYQEILEKQITSYYPNADVQPVEPYQ